MRVLVTGGTGLIGTPTVRKLLEYGHEVRLLARSAERDAAKFVGNVEPFEGSVTDDVAGAAEGCEAVIHIAGIAQETAELTFEAVNIRGTENIVREAERGGVKRLLYVSSLGVDTGTSNYHQSKRQAEAIIRAFSGEWVILRPGNVYGPGDEVLSLYARMVQTLPAVPVIDFGDQKAQPIWTGDVAEALVLCLDRGDVNGRVLELAGPDLVSASDVIDILGVITGKKPAKIPIPSLVASAGTGLLTNLGIQLPFSTDQITMLVEGNRIPEGSPNGLDQLGVTPTPIEQGLRMLLDTAPVNLAPDEGQEITETRHEIHIATPALDAAELMDAIKGNIRDVFTGSPIRSESDSRLRRGEDILIEMPMRGQVQVRVVHETTTSMTLAPVQGHPLAGAANLECIEQPEGLMFRIVSYTAPANTADAVMMGTFGGQAQKATWETVIQNIVRMSGGLPASELRESSRVLTAEESREAVEALRNLEVAWERDEGNPARLI